VHCADDEEGRAEKDTLVVEHAWYRERRDEHRDQRDEQRSADDAFLRIEDVRQRRVGRPRPPQGAEHEHAVADPGERRVVR
jgi:hypothetical protein